MKKITLLFVWMITLPHLSFAHTFSPNASYQVCFTPGENCTEEIVTAIKQAEHSILVQAYNFTSLPIERALIGAHRRGVDVKIIFDKSQNDPHFKSPRYLRNAGIPILIDSQPAIAHNKVMIIDDQKVITGSFNFTRAAQTKNAENVLIITDPQLAQHYRKNWSFRANSSRINAIASLTPKNTELYDLLKKSAKLWEQVAHYFYLN
jgi:phosphatidylserine/phosphatidylglycerophosphate/cardiolipin synthase-like enzyme